MIDLIIVEAFHDILIEEFGGLKGIRDKNLLESALARPYASFDQQDLYPGAVAKAAAIFESLVINHPFLDGNKRIAYVTMRLTLNNYGFDIDADENQKYNLVIQASQGIIRFDGIKDWITSKLIKL